MRAEYELLIRFAGPLGYALAIPLLRAAHPDAPFLLILALPLALIAADRASVRGEAAAPHGARRLAVYLTAVAYLSLIGWGAFAAARHAPGLPALVLAIGLGSGVFAMLAAHDLVHRPARADKILALLLLTAMTYRHFRISHLQGHHRWAATDADVVTARRGESAYAFLWRSVRTQFMQSFRAEQRRLARAGGGMWRNRLVHDGLTYLALYGALWTVFGGRAAAFVALQSVAAIVVLELFNYVAHYGLTRAALPDGGVEPLRAMHSWDASGRVGNWLLFDMGDHAAHHGACDEQAPALPGGYAGAILLALVPPLWRARMDARLDRRASSAVAVCLLVILLAGCGGARLPLEEPVTASVAPPEGAVARGAYLVALANCKGCHTNRKNDGRPFAGGGEVLTDYGTYYSRNITPDPVHGIGRWTDRVFIRAMRQGIAPNGDYYFPAFPYTSFTGMSERDILDIKAYLMTQKPESAVNKRHQVGFPYNSRTAIGFWRFLYFKPSRILPDPEQSTEWNRGNYLVNAVAHCGECHSPRNKFGAIDDKRRFAGGRMGTPGGRAVPNYARRVPNITPHMIDGIGKWSTEQIVLLLQIGQRPDRDFVAAPMSEVIEGTSKLTAADRRAMAVYLKSLPALPGRGG